MELTKSRDLRVDAAARERAMRDPGGDAVDSIVAVWTVWDTLRGHRLQPNGDCDISEGFIYF